MKIIKTLTIFILLLLLFSCQKDKIKFVKDMVIDDSLTANGYMKNDLKIGYWKYFDLQKNLVAISDYKIINNRTYLNQEVVFDKQGDTLFDKSNFFTCKTEVINKDSLLLKVAYHGLFEEFYGLFVYNDTINNDFSNVDGLKLDSIFFGSNKFEIKIPKDKKLKGIIQEFIFLEEGGMQIREVYFDFGKDYQDISEIKNN